MSQTCAPLWLTATLVAAFICTGRTCAQDEVAAAERVTIANLRLGFNSAYKVGAWTPLAVTLSSPSGGAIQGDLTFQIIDGDGASTTVHEPVAADAGKNGAVVRTLVKPGRPQAAVKARFESPAGTVEQVFAEDQIPQALLATQELIVEVPRPIGLARLPQFYLPANLERPATAHVEDPRALPRDWLGYDGVDIMAVTTSDVEALNAWEAAQVDALDRWVRLGGRLILCVGRNGAGLSAEEPREVGQPHPLSVFLPGRFERVVERGPGPWESFAGATGESMQGVDGGRVEPIPVTHLTDLRGRVELAEDNGKIPLVVRTAHGFGEVLFVAADLDQPPFADWSARTKLLWRLLNRAAPTGGTSAAREANVQGIRLGYTDLAGQLRAALGQFAGAAMVPFWVVFFLALGYAAAIFPLEFAIARWLRPRFEAAWILLPLLLAGSAVGIWLIAVNWKGKETLINKVEVVDVDLADGTMRGHAWLGVYSPRTDSYDLDIALAGRAMKSDRVPRLSWLGLPGTGLGGMNSPMVGVDQFERGYRFGEQGGLAEVPFAAWSSKVFEANWHASITATSAQLGERGGNQPLGVIKNRTGVKLDDCVLFYEGWSYQLGALEPEESANVGTSQRLLTVKSYLTGRRTVGDKEQATPYEPDGAELRRIARAILFHEAAGERQYTSLSNRVYDRLDLSYQLRLDRAVLMATGTPATRLRLEGKSSGEPQIESELAIYRFVIPVDRGDTSDDDQPTVELRLD